MHIAHFQRMAPALRLAALPSTIRLLSHKKNSGFHPLYIMNFVFVCSVLELFGGLEYTGGGSSRRACQLWAGGWNYAGLCDEIFH